MIFYQFCVYYSKEAAMKSVDVPAQTKVLSMVDDLATPPDTADASQRDGPIFVHSFPTHYSPGN